MFSASFAPPCLRVDMPVSLRLTILFLVKPLPALGVWPRRHAEQQHLLQAPYTIGPARRHRRGPRPPLRGGAGPMGELGLWQGLTYARVGQTEIWSSHGRAPTVAATRLRPGLACCPGARPRRHAAGG